MSAPLTENNLFSVLREYASRLEVQYMIEEEVKAFQKKVLPRILSEAFTTASDAAETTSQTFLPPSFSAAAPSPAATIPDSEWVQTFLKAHVDDVLGRRLPSMIAQEVQQQLRNAVGGALAPSSLSGSPPYDDSPVPVASARARAGLPPLPPSPHPSQSPPCETTPVSAGRRTPEPQGDDNRDSTLGSSAAHDEGRRQREKILNAVADMDRQLKGLQREVDEVVHHQRLSRCRLEYFCETLQGTALSLGAESKPPSLCVALEQALDDRKTDVVRARLASILQGLLLLPTEPDSGRVADIHNETVFSYGGSSSLAPQVGRLSHNSLASVKADAVPSSSHETPLPLQHRSSSCVHRDAQAPSLIATGAIEAPPAKSLYSSGMHPVNSAPTSAHTLTDAPHGDASETAAPLPKAQRSIKTRGTAASAATTKAVSPSPRPSMQQSSALLTANETAPPPLPLLRQQSCAPLDAGGTVSQSAPLTQMCADMSLRKRFSRGTHETVSMQVSAGSATDVTSTPSPASCTDHARVCFRGSQCRRVPSSSTPVASPREVATARGAPPDVVLGIDAVDIPSGVLPGTLGQRGAVRVESVSPLQLADRSGVCRGDVLLSVNHRPVGSCEQLRTVLRALRATQLSVAVELYRHTIQEIIMITLHL
ncbi:hypothetical protein, unknown function [Leishmania tarentolae]|uniref:PDZ domain-containing protein n=1 Tax=Leishmania tarentolae TaxID=5689 RepID=A0A640KB80_LEITA|nr:hypothetical protein, unknown function [Leishmania tarentolae]